MKTLRPNQNKRYEVSIYENLQEVKDALTNMTLDTKNAEHMKEEEIRPIIAYIGEVIETDAEKPDYEKYKAKTLFYMSYIVKMIDGMKYLDLEHPSIMDFITTLDATLSADNYNNHGYDFILSELCRFVSSCASVAARFDLRSFILGILLLEDFGELPYALLGENGKDLNKINAVYDIYRATFSTDYENHTLLFDPSVSVTPDDVRVYALEILHERTDILDENYMQKSLVLLDILNHLPSDMNVMRRSVYGCRFLLNELEYVDDCPSDEKEFLELHKFTQLHMKALLEYEESNGYYEDYVYITRRYIRFLKEISNKEKYQYILNNLEESIMKDYIYMKMGRILFDVHIPYDMVLHDLRDMLKLIVS